MRASSRRKNNGPVECANTQLSLFNRSVIAHAAADEALLCANTLAESKRHVMETARKTYPQKWHEYTAAQTNEKSKFLELLFALCEGLEEPPQHMGRPRVPLSDRIFSVAFKVYSTVSARRFTSDLREARQRGYTSNVPTYVSVSRYLESEELTPVLKHLIEQSSLPLKDVEQDFAVDSSGFSNGIATRWFNAKYTKKPEATMIEWVKVHIMVGTRTHIITSAEVSERRDHDYKFFQPLVESTAQNFSMREVSADKAYSGLSNLRLVVDNGAQPFIPFKKNMTDHHWRSYKDKTGLWKRMFHFFKYHEAAFYRHYHKRSNVETVFAMVKGKFGERLRSKTRTAQINEVLCKILCHNLCVLVSAMYELGLDVTFETKTKGVT